MLVLVRSRRDEVTAKARPARSVELATGRVTLAGMSERREQADRDDPVRDEIAAVVGRARDAARAIEHYTQEQVDELVTAVAWAVVRKDHAEALARLAVDEGGFGNYADKVAKINKRVTGVLADMSGIAHRRGGGAAAVSGAGEDRQAGRRGGRADPDHRPGRHPAGQGPVRAEGPQRDHLRPASADPAGHRGGRRVHARGLRAGRRARGPGAVTARAVTAEDAGADAPGRPGGGYRRGRHGTRRVQLRHPRLRGRRRQCGARGGRDR